MTLLLHDPFRTRRWRSATVYFAPILLVTIRGRHGAPPVAPEHRTLARNLRRYRRSHPGDRLGAVRRPDHHRHRSRASDMSNIASAKPGMARVTWQQADPVARCRSPDDDIRNRRLPFWRSHHAGPCSGFPGSTARDETGRPVCLQRARHSSATTRSPIACKPRCDDLFPADPPGSSAHVCMATPTTRRSMTTLPKLASPTPSTRRSISLRRGIGPRRRGRLLPRHRPSIRNRGPHARARHRTASSRPPPIALREALRLRTRSTTTMRAHIISAAG